MLLNILLGVLGVILFLFVFWKRLNEDYSSDIIFQSGVSVLLGLTVGLTFSILFFPEWFFWISLLGSLVGMTLMILKFKLRFYESLEALIFGAMPLVSLMFFKNSITNSSLNSFLAFVASLVLIFLAYWLDVNYKSFTWYKSGRIGFAGLFIAATFFLVRTVVAFFRITMISFVSNFEGILSGAVTLICIGLLVNLSRKQ